MLCIYTWKLLLRELFLRKEADKVQEPYRFPRNNVTFSPVGRSNRGKVLKQTCIEPNKTIQGRKEI
jgi:hypothetical protein